VVTVTELVERYDVVVVGGGAAGLNGAMLLARSRRSVVVVDAGHPRNAPAAAVHGLLGREGTPPAELLAKGRQGFGGSVVEGEVVSAERRDDHFVVTLADGRTTTARRLLVTTGLVDELPDVPGVAERWGHTVLHCPYCHGWEVRDQAVVVLGSGPQSVHQALLFRQLTADVTYVSHDAPPDEEHLERLAARDIAVVDGTAVALEGEADRLALRLADGDSVPLQALVVAPRMVARTSFLADLGLEPVPHPMGVGVHVPVDETGRTSVEGVWAAGNISDLSAQVGASAAAGAFAGAQINGDLVMEDAARAVAERRRAVLTG
jgi:thioredoxin reductase